MKTIMKYVAAATLTGALALAAATPSQARHWHRGGAALGGFAAGAVLGAAAASSYYGPGYYYGPGPYAYDYAPGYVDEGSYAYEPAPTYYRRYRERAPVCASDLGYGRLDYSSC